MTTCVSPVSHEVDWHMYMMNINVSDLKATVKLAIANAVFFTCHACCSFSLAVDPILSSSFGSKVIDLVSFKSSVNPTTLTKALYLIHHI